MQENNWMQKHGKLLRIVALLAALVVIGGSILAFFMPQGTGASSGRWGLSAAHAEEWKVLKKGSSGAEVRKAQEALRNLGYYDGKIDGNFSKVLEAAVIAFQEDFGLKVTGALDEETYLLITEDMQDIPSANPAVIQPDAAAPPAEEEGPFVVFGEEYEDKLHVAAYLREFGELPPNYITKKQAQALGWVNSKGNLWKIAPGKSIGGDSFGNYEGQLPTEKGRKYFECDIDYHLDVEQYRGGRNAKRIIYSNDGLIFYTEDHYTTFEDLTLEENGK